MIKLLKRTKLLSSICAISLVISIARVLTTNIPELFDGAEEWFTFVDNLSLAYIASYCFYVVQVYLPELKAAKAALPRRCAIQREVQIFVFQYLNIWQRINSIDKSPGPAELDIKVFLSSEKLLENSKKIKFDEESDALNFYKKRNATWKEEITYYIENIDDRGLEIIRYNKDFIPCDVYYAIYNMLNHSLMSGLKNFFSVVPISSLQTLYECLPKDNNEEIDTSKEIEMLTTVINWVNEEYELLKNEMDSENMKTLHKLVYYI